MHTIDIPNYDIPFECWTCEKYVKTIKTLRKVNSMHTKDKSHRCMNKEIQSFVKILG